MYDRFPSSDPLNNYFIRHENLPSQHEGALRAYYWSIDRVMNLSDGGDAIKGIVMQLLEDHYGVSDVQAEQLLARSSADLPLTSTFQNDEVRQVNKETLLLFPLLEIGSFVDESYEPAASVQWYTQVGAAILERTSDTHSDDCLQRREGGCSGDARCPWRVVVDVLTKQATDPDFASIEYTVEPERQIEMVIAKLVAARTGGVSHVDSRDIRDIAEFYQVLTKTVQVPATDEPL